MKNGRILQLWLVVLIVPWDLFCVISQTGQVSIFYKIGVIVIYGRDIDVRE